MEKNKKSKVAVGLSGGVDSSVSAFLLKEMGYDVVGLFMKNWENGREQRHCAATQDYEDALSVAHALQIPLHSWDFSKEYWNIVFSSFLQDLKCGFTPNPDILCNKEIKFKIFLNKIMKLGISQLATGHYAGISEKHDLLRGWDERKEQSYFLYTLNIDTLRHLIFPLAKYRKTEVRTIAQQIGLDVHNKRDSTGICFIGEQNFNKFISQYLKPKPGWIKTPEGKIVGQHEGIWHFTIGQRKGLEIGGEGEAWFVYGKDARTNEVFVAQGKDHSLLYSSALLAFQLSWVKEPPTLPCHCTAKIRYRQEDQACIIEKSDENFVRVSFSQPQRAITPRQAIVFYQNAICLGGGTIFTCCT